MAQVLTNKVGFKVGATSPASIDLSTYVTSFTLNRSFDELDVTAMGDTGARAVKGLERSSITVDLINDDAASAVLQTLNTLWGTNAYFKCALDNTAAGSASNPFFSGLILINNITPINGAVTDLGMQSLTFNVSGAITTTTTGTW
jgi:hypothetical protein